MSPATLHRIAQDAVTLFVVINPIGLVPLFIAVTGGQTAKSRRRIALRAVVIAGAILVAFIVVGQIVLEALGISLASFRIAGGLVLLVIALKMVLEDRAPAAQPGAEDGTGEDAARSVAVFPLALPFIAGPGAIMAVVLLTDNSRFGIPEQTLTTAILIVILAITMLVLLAAGQVQRVLGMTGASVVSRVMGLILAALAVESSLEGVRLFFGTH